MECKYVCTASTFVPVVVPFRQHILLGQFTSYLEYTMQCFIFCLIYVYNKKIVKTNKVYLSNMYKGLSENDVQIIKFQQRRSMNK